jgi:hypothetical protein
MSLRRLDGPEQGQLRDRLKAAFPRDRFDEFLLYRLDKRAGDFTSRIDDDLTYFHRILEAANAGRWWPQLLVQARNLVPEDPDLAEFADRFGLAPRTFLSEQGTLVRVQAPQLELKIRKWQATFDIVGWRTRLGDLEGRVCRIEYPETVAQGTGFLISPNVVMTNYHVIENIHKGKTPSSEVVLRFDYKVMNDGVSVGAGTKYGLAADRDWLFDHSPYSPFDEQIEPSGEPSDDELDYALLCVKGEPGNDPIGGATSDSKFKPRGWVELPMTHHDFLQNRALYIVEHPDGMPLQVAIDSNAILSVNRNGTRVRYTTTTQPGSSGSPCFNDNWDWIALHHSGDPKYSKGLKPAYNEGIPVMAIRNHLKKKSLGTVFGRKV